METHCGNYIRMCSGCADLICAEGKAQCDGCQLVDAERKIEQLEAELDTAKEEFTEIGKLTDVLALEVEALRRGVGVSYSIGDDPIQKLKEIRNVVKV